MNGMIKDPTPAKPIHYRAAGKGHPCKADVPSWHGHRFTSDLRRATCRYCLAWAVRIALKKLDA